MGSSNSAPPPPDYTPIANALQSQSDNESKLAQEQLDWAKGVYAQNQPINDQAVQEELNTQKSQDQFAAEQRQRYTSEFQPEEDALVKDANTYASDSMKDLQRGRAESGVAQNFESQRQNAQQNLEGFGINPGSTRYAALDLGVRTQQAAATAAAANQADLQTDSTARALRDEAINVGRGYPGQVAGTYGSGTSAGSTAVNSDNSTFATGASAQGTAPQYMGLSNQALGTWGGTLNQGYQNQLGQFNANQTASSGVGQALGLAAGMGTKFLFASKGGAIEDPDGDQVYGKKDTAPFDPKKFYLLHAKDDEERLMGHQETMQRFFQHGKHIGAFDSPEEAQAHLEHGHGRLVQRQDYEKFADGGGAIPMGAGPQAGQAPPGTVPAGASPSSGKAIDDVPARLNVGEFVVPRDVAAWKGEEFFQKMIQQSRQAKQKAPAKPDVRQALPVG